jgi:hypothetical protein
MNKCTKDVYQSREKSVARNRDSHSRGEGLSRQALRLLEALAEQNAEVRAHPFEEGSVVLRRNGNAAVGGVSLGGGSFPETALAELSARDLVARDGRRYLISAPGKALLRRCAARSQLVARGEMTSDAFADQHRNISMEVLVRDGEAEGEGSSAARVRVNHEESPLVWLAARKNGDGEPLINAAQFQAGERFRRDLTIAGIMPGTTMNWDRLGGSGDRSAPRETGLNATEACIAARQRVAGAIRHLGAQDADLLIDLCGFLVRLPDIERARGWPSRSAKIMIARALDRLAEHYGLAPQAQGRSRAVKILTWFAEEASP